MLTEGLVGCFLLILHIIYVRIIGGVHLRVRFVDWVLGFLGLRCYITYTAHATLEANIVHLIDRLARLLHYAQVTVFVHGGYLTFEAIHEIRRLCRLPS